jgi:hypothetical protein
LAAVIRVRFEPQQPKKKKRLALLSPVDPPLPFFCIELFSFLLSGKSTLFKQIVRMSEHTPEESEVLDYIRQLRTQTLLAMQILLEQTADLPSSEYFEAIVSSSSRPISEDDFRISDERTPLAELVMAQEGEESSLTAEIADAIDELWKNEPALKLAWQYRSRFEISDAASFLFDRVKAFAEKDFVPAAGDYVLTRFVFYCNCCFCFVFCCNFLLHRLPTTGIIEYSFSVPQGNRNTPFRLIDVGSFFCFVLLHFFLLVLFFFVEFLFLFFFSCRFNYFKRRWPTERTQKMDSRL